MKKLLSFKFLNVMIIFMIITSTTTAGTFHVVVGSFSEAFAAWNFARAVEYRFQGASVTYDEDLKLHHVTVFETSRYDVAKSFRDELGRGNGFVNAWVYARFGEGDVPAGVEGVDDPISLELYTGGTVLLSSADNRIFGVSTVANQERAAPDVSFTFAARTTNGIAIPGKALVLDRRGQALLSVPTGKAVHLSGDASGQVLTVIFQSPGYMPAARTIRVGSLTRMSDVRQNEDGVWEVTLHAEKVSADHVTMWFNDLFHDGTAIIRPEKKETLDLLVSIMKARKARGIEIDAHSNGDGKRTIVVSGSSRNFFDVTAGSEKTLSGKQFTKERAERLKDYLTSQGIDRTRVQTMGWGGLDPVVRGSEVDTRKNDRIEIRVSWE